jgi:glycosyl transferase, family 25
VELQQAGIPFTIGKVELFAAIKPDSPGEFPSIGYRGVFLSHLTILKQAKSQGLNNVLIMEDDLEIRSDFRRYEENILNELIDQDWDIVHFGYCGQPVGNLSAVSLPILQAFSGEIIGTQFYAVNSRIFDQLIDFFEVILTRPADHPDGAPMSPDGVLNIFKWQFPRSHG